MIARRNGEKLEAEEEMVLVKRKVSEEKEREVEG